MQITVNELDDKFEIHIDNYVYTTDKSGMTKDEIYNIVNNNASELLSILQQQELENIRAKRQEEFALFDKYQLTLLWNSLTQQQQQEYADWRNAWLNATVTKIIPNRLDWFKAE